MQHTHKSARGRKSLLPLITLNKPYGRIYFSRKLVVNHELADKCFSFKRANGNWYLDKFSDKHVSARLQTHNGSFFMVNKALVEELIDSFNCQQSIQLLVEEENNNANAVQLSFHTERKDKRRKKRRQRAALPFQTSAPKADGTDFYAGFSGRIKTNETIANEKRMATRIKSLMR